jgi:hypothetical protein
MNDTGDAGHADAEADEHEGLVPGDPRGHRVGGLPPGSVAAAGRTVLVVRRLGELTSR